ncbi:CLUMA_CG003329, isoform A [Clunio marinus]|uniref:CLUMA_CG003329, isoform A n=1 Tax=Clunio marinus TaxID=568069 RepID=A0A1J1HNE4_9DIPT|nr:CLUMA_CG003329, isoform A [Clunio marinus]
MITLRYAHHNQRFVKDFKTECFAFLSVYLYSEVFPFHPENTLESSLCFRCNHEENSMKAMRTECIKKFPFMRGLVLHEMHNFRRQFYVIVSNWVALGLLPMLATITFYEHVGLRMKSEKVKKGSSFVIKTSSTVNFTLIGKPQTKLKEDEMTKA